MKGCFVFFIVVGAYCWNYTIGGKDKASIFLCSGVIIVVWVGTVGRMLLDFWCRLLIMLSEGKCENLLLNSIIVGLMWECSMDYSVYCCIM